MGSCLMSKDKQGQCSPDRSPCLSCWSTFWAFATVGFHAAVGTARRQQGTCVLCCSLPTCYRLCWVCRLQQAPSCSRSLSLRCSSSNSSTLKQVSASSWKLAGNSRAWGLTLAAICSAPVVLCTSDSYITVFASCFLTASGSSSQVARLSSIVK